MQYAHFNKQLYCVFFINFGNKTISRTFYFRGWRLLPKERRLWWWTRPLLSPGLWIHGRYRRCPGYRWYPGYRRFWQIWASLQERWLQENTILTISILDPGVIHDCDNVSWSFWQFCLICYNLYQWRFVINFVCYIFFFWYFLIKIIYKLFCLINENTNQLDLTYM